MDNATFYYRVGFGNGILFAAIFFIVLSMLIPPVIRIRAYRVADPQTIRPDVTDVPETDEPEQTGGA